jgi:hypothetical protein
MSDSALWIELSDGSRFYYHTSDFKVRPMAASLSKMCRYNGHSKAFYSVAQHSILVADIMTNLMLGDPREGLLHDGQESILGDIPSPWKVLLPEYKKVEHVLEQRLRKQFDLPEKITDGCKKADFMSLFIETSWLIPSKGLDWEAPPGLKEEAAVYMDTYTCPEVVWSVNPARIEGIFLTEFQRLFGNIPD